jgi:hypothetical protein
MFRRGVPTGLISSITDQLRNQGLIRLRKILVAQFKVSIALFEAALSENASVDVDPPIAISGGPATETSIWGFGSRGLVSVRRLEFLPCTVLPSFFFP